MPPDERCRGGGPRDSLKAWWCALVNLTIENDLRESLRNFEQHSLLALLWAAAAGRTGRRNLSLVAVSIAEALSVNEVRPRARRVELTDLDAILRVARERHQAVDPADDFEPPDPMLVVRWRIGGRRLRIDPGLYEDPVGKFVELERLAILDDEAVRAVGFGLADLMEVALRSMDRELARLSPIWSTDIGGEGKGSRGISSSEFELARHRFPGGALAGREVERVLNSCTNPERARRALNFATAPGTALSTDLTSTLPLWDGVMAIAIGERRCFVPSSLMLEGLDRAAAKLAARLDQRKRFRSRRSDLAHAALCFAVRELDNDVIFPVEIGTERPVVVVRPDERHLLVFDVVSGATEDRLAQEMHAAASSLRTIDAHREWTSPVGPLAVPDDAEIVTLIVADVPHRVVIDTVNQPVAVTLNDLQHIVGGVEDSVELWEFLTEVVNPPRIERMIAPGLPELYELWKAGGSLNSDYVAATEARVGCSTFPDFWTVSSAWEPFDAVLAEAGRHSSSHIRRRQMVLPNEAHFWSREPMHLTIVRTEPNLILEVPLDDLGPLDVQIVANFASMLSAAAEQLEPFGRAVGACGPGLQIQIQANASRPAVPELDRDDPWIGGASFKSPRPVAVIRFDYHLLALFVESPVEARHFLAVALGQSLSELGASKRLSAECVDAWRSWDGAFHAVVTESAPLRPFVAARTTRVYDTARVWRELSDRLRAEEVESGSFSDEDAIRFCDQHITSALYSMLVDEIATYDRFQLLARGASEVGAALGEQRRRSIEIRTGLETSWADDLRMEESVGSAKLAKWVRAVQLVLELSLRGGSGGQRNVGRTDWARLLAVADSLFEISQIRAQARFLLEPFEIDLDDDGRVAMRLGGSSTFELLEFDVLRRLFQLRPVDQDELTRPDDREEESPGEGESDYERIVRSMDGRAERNDAPFESFIAHPEVPSKLRVVDAAMRKHLGTGYDAILATLRTAGSWKRDPGGEYAEVDRTFLVNDIRDWSGLPEAEVLAAIELLTLRAEDLRSEAHSGVYPYWHVERRKFRCATRPFLEVDAEKVWVVPELATGTQRVLTRYLVDGRLPWPDLPAPLDKRLEDYRQTQNLRLEQLAEEGLNRAGFIARRGLKPAMLRRAGVPIPDSTGEIDVLVADNLRRRLWVIEAKDPEEPFTTHELWSGAKEFRRHHEAQLNRKLEAVVGACDEFVAFLGAEPNGDWVVSPLFLTSRVELAAFDERIDVPFVVLDDIVEMLQGETPPVRGCFVPKWARRLLVSKGSVDETC